MLAMIERDATAATEFKASIDAADDEALLAAEAFAFGRFDKYINAKVADIERRIDEHFGTADHPSGPVA